MKQLFFSIRDYLIFLIKVFAFAGKSLYGLAAKRFPGSFLEIRVPVSCDFTCLNSSNLLELIFLQTSCSFRISFKVLTLKIPRSMHGMMSSLS